MTREYRQPVPKVLSQNVQYIDPTDCGSMVGFRIVDEDYDTPSIQATITLTECSRMVSWGISCDDAGLKKISAAIDVLQAAFVAVCEASEILKKQKKAHAKKIAKEKKQKQ